MKRIANCLFLLLLIQLSHAQAQVIYGDNTNGLAIIQKGKLGFFVSDNSNGKPEGDAVSYDFNETNKSKALTHMFVNKGVVKAYTIFYADSAKHSTVSSFLIENGKQNGKGIFIDQGGLVYFGNLLNNGPDGLVHTLFVDNKMAYTTFKNNVPVAFDSASTSEGCTYGNCKEGPGRLFTKGRFYQGNFANGIEADGPCIIRFQDKGSDIVQVGNKVNNAVSGYGLQKELCSFYFFDFSKSFNSIYDYYPASGVEEAQVQILGKYKFHYDALQPKSLFLAQINDKGKLSGNGIKVTIPNDGFFVSDGEFNGEEEIINGIKFEITANDTKLVVVPRLFGNGRLSNMIKPVFYGFEITEKLANSMVNNKVAIKVPLANYKSIWQAISPLPISDTYEKNDFTYNSYYWKDAFYYKTENDSLLLIIKIHDNLLNVKEAAQEFDKAKKNPNNPGAQSQIDSFNNKVGVIRKQVTSGYNENAQKEFMNDLTLKKAYTNSTVFAETGYQLEKADESVLINQYNNYPINKEFFSKASPSFAKYNYAYLYAYLDKTGRACNAMILSKEEKITDEKGERTKTSETIMINLINLINLIK